MTTIRLYPEPHSSLYVRVHVHATKREMREHWRLSRTRFNGGSWAQRIAYCTEIRSWRVSASGASRMSGCVAEVNFYASRMGTAIVTHEMFHATMAWGRRVGLPWGRMGDDDAVNQVEERAAYAHGELCRQLVNRT